MSDVALIEPTRTGAALRVTELHKRYGGVQALAGVDLEIDAGEIHGLLGENGAGKSTLLRIITGAEQADAGTVVLDDLEVAPRDVHEARAMGVQMIFQHQHVVPELSVAHNFCLGEECVRWGITRPAVDRERARSGLSALGLAIEPAALMGDLSFAERQMVEIGKALAARSRILILDEPTAALGKQESARLFALLRDLQARHGTTIVYVSHRLEEIVDICDRVTILRDGRVVARAIVDDATTPRDLAQLIVADRAKLDAAAHAVPVDAGDVVLRADRLTAQNGLAGVSFDLRRGETLAVFGLIGSGRTELLRAVMGADRRTGGTLELDGTPMGAGGVADAAAAGVGFVPEDRHGEGLFMERDVSLNVLSGSLGRFSRAGVLRKREARRAVRGIVDRLAIRTAGLDAPVASLSGGNQQKVVVARWLIAGARVILLDEPTAGVDVGARVELYGVIDELRAHGAAVLLASSDLDEVVRLADRVLVMREGRSVALVERDEITHDGLLRLAFGEGAHAVP